MESLLPAIERNPHVAITNLYLSDRGRLSSYRKFNNDVVITKYKRWLPNALSRFFECVIFARKFDGEIPLLVFGDVPLRCSAPQTVFVQTPHLLKPPKLHLNFNEIKFAILRWVFRINSSYARAFIVQTIAMKDALSLSYPSIANRVYIIPQPVPQWLLGVHPPLKRSKVDYLSGLRLIYPAASYPHKNHRLLADIDPKNLSLWPVKSLVITLDDKRNPAPCIPWIYSIGFLDSSEMVRAYCEVDALLFLSTDESYGFPLVEAMYLGLPIICPDLPYAHSLCSEGAIYFDPYSVESLCEAVQALHKKLSDGWWPDWSEQIRKMPASWDIVSDEMIKVALAK
jgi:glycosyltransferase involved in cell wall biosynthesis